MSERRSDAVPRLPTAAVLTQHNPRRFERSADRLNCAAFVGWVGWNCVDNNGTGRGKA